MNFWEDSIYSMGRQVNRWPFDAVVSAVKREKLQSRRGVSRVLDIGCGTGNNLWLLCSEGFETYGLDISPSAVEISKTFLKEKGLQAVVGVSDLTLLPFEDGFFDLVLDRGCLTQVSWSQLPLTVSEIYRTLAPGGCHLSFTLYGEEHPDRKFGVESEPGTFTGFSEGQFAVVGPTSFFSNSSLEKLFEAFGEVRVRRNERFEGTTLVYQDYELRAEKPASLG